MRYRVKVSRWSGRRCPMSKARPDLGFSHGFSTSKGYPEPFDEATGLPALSTSTDGPPTHRRLGDCCQKIAGQRDPCAGANAPQHRTTSPTSFLRSRRLILGCDLTTVSPALSSRCFNDSSSERLSISTQRATTTFSRFVAGSRGPSPNWNVRFRSIRCKSFARGDACATA